MLLQRKRVPTSRILPLQFRKIWKKILTLQIGSGPGDYHMWRSIFGTFFALGGIYLLIGMTTPIATTLNYVAFLAPLLGLFFGLLFIIIVYQWLYIWTYFYDLDDNFIRIRKGVLIRREVTIPYNRVHDVYLDQDVMDHLLNLYDLYLATASEISHTEAHIDGLNKENATKLRNLLMERVERAGKWTEGTPRHP